MNYWCLRDIYKDGLLEDYFNVSAHIDFTIDTIHVVHEALDTI